MGEKSQDRFSNLMAIFMLIVLVYAPIHAIYRAFQFDRLNKRQARAWFNSAAQEQEKNEAEEVIKEQMQELFDGFKLNLPSLLYYLFFILRRMIMVITLILLPDYANFQCSIYVLSACFTLIYVIQVRPYDNEMLNTQEIINECFILVSSYFMLIFSDWIPNTEELTGVGMNLKSTMGLVMLIILLLCVVVNLFIVVRELCISLIAKFRHRKMVKMALVIMEHKARIKQKQLEQEAYDRKLAEAVQAIIDSSDESQRSNSDSYDSESQEAELEAVEEAKIEEEDSVYWPSEELQPSSERKEMAVKADDKTGQWTRQPSMKSLAETDHN
jgi:hypothetical protein